MPESAYARLAPQPPPEMINDRALFISGTLMQQAAAQPAMTDRRCGTIRGWAWRVRFQSSAAAVAVLRRRSMRNGRLWEAALDEHEKAVRSFVAACEQLPAGRWHQASALDKWSPSDVVLHLCKAYDLGRQAVAGHPGMRLRVTPWRAWMLRAFLMPMIFLTGRFPRGVPAPKEVLPDPAESNELSRESAMARLGRNAREAAEALRTIAEDHPRVRVMHAYFGPLTPHQALRMLSAHTQHHARELVRAGAAPPNDAKDRSIR